MNFAIIIKLVYNTKNPCLTAFERFNEIISKISERISDINYLLLIFILDSANYACVKHNRKEAKAKMKLIRNNSSVSERLSLFKPRSKKEALKLRLLKNKHYLIYYLLASLKGKGK